jgi:hypothetical protein
VGKKREEAEAELRLLEREAEPEPEVTNPGLVPPTEIDVAESRWDPWLLALARIEAQSEARVN